MALTVQTPPTAEALDLQAVKDHIREDSDEQDGLITALNTAAREYVEKALGVTMTETVYKLTLDQFPCRQWIGWGDAIQIPRPPLRSVTSIKYIDGNGVQQTFSPSAYL